MASTEEQQSTIAPSHRRRRPKQQERRPKQTEPQEINGSSINSNVLVRPFLTTGSRSLAIKDGPQARGREHLLSTFVAGVGSGALASIICAPLDLIRTRLQVWGDVADRQRQKRQSNVGVGIDRGGFGTTKKAFQGILQREGVRGLFSGLGAALVTTPLFWGVYFPLYDETKYCMTSAYPDLNESIVHCGAAVFTGAVADIICNPLFVVRTRLQTQAMHAAAAAETVERSTMTETAKDLFVKHGGIRVFWRGMSANLIGLSHVAVQFPAYEYMKRLARQRREEIEGETLGIIKAGEETPMELLVASATSKACASLLSYPHEVIRSRMMDSRSKSAPTLRGVARQIWTNEGMRGFYTALPMSLLRVIPNCCVTFLSYELFFRWTKDQLSTTKGISRSSA